MLKSPLPMKPENYLTFLTLSTAGAAGPGWPSPASLYSSPVLQYSLLGSLSRLPLNLARAWAQTFITIVRILPVSPEVEGSRKVITEEFLSVLAIWICPDYRSEDRDEARSTHQLPPTRSISTQTRQTAVPESQEALRGKPGTRVL